MHQHLTTRRSRVPETFRVVGFHLRLRPWTALCLAGCLAVLLLSAGHTVPSLQDDVRVPRPRASLPVGCGVASLVVLLVRPVLDGAERLAARDLRAARLVLLVVVVGGAFGAAEALTPLLAVPAVGVRCLTLAGALVGIGLVAGVAGLFWGLAVPWLYVLSGLAFGYGSTMEHGTLTVRPWAWLIAEQVPAGAELAVLAGGVLVAAAVRPRGT
ncbi:hypothetical protein ACFJIY_07080 [Pimelobacter simplex]|uniref:hypothetical protein n=1 Tax=Nocardioides simplex TaxID=2045 RepID=UPI003670E32D